MGVRVKVLVLLLLGALLAVPARADAVPVSLGLIGENGASKTLTLAELAAMPQAEVGLQGKDGSRVVLRGPTLRSLMTLVGAPTGHELRGPNMLLIVLAEATDGYRAAYTLAELDEQFGARKAIEALTVNGEPVPADEGPLRVAVEGEEHHARWILQLARLRLVRIAP